MKKVYMILAAALAAATILSCEKKETVIEKLKGFFERFWNIG